MLNQATQPRCEHHADVTLGVGSSGAASIDDSRADDAGDALEFAERAPRHEEQ